MYYAYIRVSTDHQNVENQKHEITQFTLKQEIYIDRWVEEVISSRKALKDRKLGALLKKMRRHDVLIATEISRLGRNLLEVMSILQFCLDKDCQVWTLKENYRLGSDIQSKVLAFAFGLAGEIERQMISDRTKNSLRRLKDEGKHLGRPYGVTYEKLTHYHKHIKQMLQENMTKADIARELNCSWLTAHRYIREHLPEYEKTEEKRVLIKKETPKKTRKKRRYFK